MLSYSNDTKNCNNTKFKYEKKSKHCGQNVVNSIKEKCEGKIYCTLIPSKHFFKNVCINELNKYLYLEYHCNKNKVNILIITFIK